MIRRQGSWEQFHRYIRWSSPPSRPAAAAAPTPAPARQAGPRSSPCGDAAAGETGPSSGKGWAVLANRLFSLAQDLAQDLRRNR